MHALLAVCSAAAIGCGQWVGAPSDIDDMSGAAISGTVMGPTSSSIAAIAPPPSVLANTAPSELTVVVVGTKIRADVDAHGRFDLSNVPAGTVQLRFTGRGIDAVVVLSNVGGRELVEVLISLSGPTATVVNEARRSGKVTLCHATGNGRYQPIEVSVNAKPAHQAHGDGEVGMPVPSDPTKEFSSNCQAVDPSEHQEDEESEGPKVQLCHRTGNGSYHLIEVSVASENAHRAHGDGKVGEAVPGVPGAVFTSSCSVG